jgi:hypothetical protein
MAHERERIMSQPPKKPFVDPHLVVYGDIKELTQAVGKVGSPDTGGVGQKVKTR